MLFKILRFRCGDYFNNGRQWTHFFLFCALRLLLLKKKKNNEHAHYSHYQDVNDGIIEQRYPLHFLVLFCTLHIHNLWSLKKDFPFGQSQKWLRASNIQQHIKLWTVSTPFGGCYYAIELTLLIKMLNLDHII